MPESRDSALRPTMLYWTSPDGIIVRAESQNVDGVLVYDETFAAPFRCNRILGCSLFGFISGPEIAHLYRVLARQVFETGHAVKFVYRCDSPAIRREMSMEVSRDEDMIRYKSVILRETLRSRMIPWQTPEAPSFVAICSFCQNYRFPISTKIWKELENLLVEEGLPERFSFTHGICELCLSTALRELGGVARDLGSS